jgi:prepilin-type N-terminal cleavage/methylation domain-containing protein
MSRTDDDHGFTLFEMLIAIAIGGLIASSAILSFSRLSDRLITDEFMNRAIDLLSETAAVARRTGLDQTVRLNTTQRTLESSSGKVLPIADGVSIAWVAAEEVQSDAGQAFQMFATGGSSGGNITITRGSISASIEVDWLTGNTRQMRAR